MKLDEIVKTSLPEMTEHLTGLVGSMPEILIQVLLTSLLSKALENKTPDGLIIALAAYGLMVARAESQKAKAEGGSDASD